ncbi:MAG: undecaprenyl-diphosphate phosphatase [Deltaproteobacteria bacterium]|nr:undecaprenyl-diphosphate phosphatase [Deltaproteobacteria bacterium]
MNLSTAIILGIVQGLTELFPVSSSAHLVILQSFFPDFQQSGVAFDAILHLGTLIAVVLYFHVDLWAIFKAFLPQQFKTASDTTDVVAPKKLFLFLIIGTIPVVIIGFLFKDYIHGIFQSARAAAFFLIITGFLLFFSDKVTNAQRDKKDMNITDSIFIGIAQALALLPGISRSGATITAGIFRRINRTDAARFSFLLSIPAVCGAVILEAGYFKYIPSSEIWMYFAGFICAALTGLMSLKLFFLVIGKARLKFFAYYCWIFGMFTLLVKSSFF